LAAIGIMLLAVACENPGKDKPQAQVGQAAPRGEQTSPPVSEQVAITPENSKVGFIGAKVTGKHDGGFTNFNGTIALSPSGPAASQVTLEIDMTSIWADNERLTGHLKSPDFFDVEKFPKATFTSTKIEPAATGGSNFTVTGNLDMHGVVKSISFPATIDVTPAEVAVAAEFALNRQDFGVSYPGKPDDLIRDEVVLSLSVKAPRKTT
jgi:polyisoprenoid-binding protein YceI